MKLLQGFKMLLNQNKKSFVDVLKMSYCELPGVNFANILRAHFSQRKAAQFVLYKKYARKTLMKLTPVVK